MSDKPEKIPHSVDGIEEYDNPIPRWLMWLLYGTIVFAVVYWVLYPGFWAGASGWTTEKMYETEMERAAEMYATPEGESVDVASLVGDPAAVSSGQKIYSRNCAPCHGADATGAIGPNLADDEWIYGGTPVEVASTISGGTDGGMPPWESQLGEKKIAEVTAYIKSLGK